MRALLPLLSVLLASVASGQAPLSGTLSAPDGTPYADVEVRLESGRLDIPDSTRTDAEGRFAFERAVAGAIVVSTGGEPLWLPLAIPDGASGPFTLDLVVPRVRGEGADYLAGFRASGTRPLAEVLSVYVAAEAGHRTPATSPELEAATEEMQARVSEAPLDRKNAVRDSLRALVGPLYEAALQPRIDAYDAALPAGALEGTATAHAFWRLYRITPDSLTALRVLETVPTDAPLWSFQGLSRSGVNNTLFLLARALVPDGGPVPAPLDAYFRALAYGYPDPNVRAQASGVLVGVLRSAGDDQRAAVGVDRLYREHPDSYQAERLRRDEAEDRRVQAGRQLPDFAIPSLADSTVMITRADLSGKTVLVD
ncbi:MAG: carboxypeptidase-like regulatory domain-containing protein, partial [Bacteroidota bacterium]